MEMRDDEHRVRQRNVDDHIAEEEAGQPAIDEGDDEAERKQHGDGEMDVAAPQRQHPIIDLDGGRDRDDQRRGCEEEPECGFMPLTYMWCAQTTKLSAPIGDDRPHHHAIAEDVAVAHGC